MKKKIKRRVKDSRKAIRKDQPDIEPEIKSLVGKFLKSKDYKAFKERFKRR